MRAMQMFWNVSRDGRLNYRAPSRSDFGKARYDVSTESTNCHPNHPCHGFSTSLDISYIGPELEIWPG